MSIESASVALAEEITSTTAEIAIPLTVITDQVTAVDNLAIDIAANKATVNSTVTTVSGFKTTAQSNNDSIVNTMDASHTTITTNGDTGLPGVRPTVLLDFANSKSLPEDAVYTRASTALYYDNETFAKAEENQLTYSQDFTQKWVQHTSTITPNTTTAPDGTLTASTMTTPGNGLTYESIINNTNFKGHNKTSRISIYVKYIDKQYIQLLSTGSANFWCNFDILNGTLADYNATFISNPLIENKGNGWYRCSVDVTNYPYSISPHVVAIDAANNGYAFKSVVGGSYYLWGAQLEGRAELTDYIPTTTQQIRRFQPVLVSSQINEPRFDHDPITGESKGLQIEEQRTNYIDNSETFPSTGADTVVYHNSQVDVLGNVNASKLVPGILDQQHNISAISTTTLIAGKTVTFSVYAKAGEYGGIVLTHNAFAGFGRWSYVAVNLFTGTISGGVNVDSSIQHVGNGWYRISFTDTLVADAIPTAIIKPANNPDNTGQGPSFAGDAYSGLFICAPQVEEGYFPTSYIPTIGTTATRSEDEMKLVDELGDEWSNGEQYTIVADLYNNPNPISGNYWPLMLRDANNSINMVGIRFYSVNLYGYALGNLSQVYTPYVFEKWALSYSKEKFSGCVAGQLPVSVVPVILHERADALWINGFGSGCTTWFKKLAYYPVQFTDSQMTKITEV